MDAWVRIWTWLLVTGLAGFIVLAVVVSIRGFADVRALFKNVRAQHDREAD